MMSHTLLNVMADDDGQDCNLRKTHLDLECELNINSSEENRKTLLAGEEKEFSSRIIFIGPSKSPDTDIACHFDQFGTVLMVLQMQWNNCNIKREYGFVQFKDFGSSNNTLQIKKHNATG